MGFVNPLKDWRTLQGGEATLLDIVFFFATFSFFSFFVLTFFQQPIARKRREFS